MLVATHPEFWTWWRLSAAIFSNVKVAKTFFGLSLLLCDKVAKSFTEDIIIVWHAWWCPVPSFCDYIVDNFVVADSDFPPTLWADAPVLMPVTTYGAESYHEHLNADFNAPHPNIYILVEALLRQQAATYVTVSSLSKSRLSRTIPRYKRENPLAYPNFYRLGLFCRSSD